MLVASISGFHARGLLTAIVMGKPDQFATSTFAVETNRVTGGAITWQDPPEIGLESVQADGLLVVRRPEKLAGLRAPWRAARM